MGALRVGRARAYWTLRVAASPHQRVPAGCPQVLASLRRAWPRSRLPGVSQAHRPSPAVRGPPTSRISNQHREMEALFGCGIVIIVRTNARYKRETQNLRDGPLGARRATSGCDVLQERFLYLETKASPDPRGHSGGGPCRSLGWARGRGALGGGLRAPQLRAGPSPLPLLLLSPSPPLTLLLLPSLLPSSPLPFLPSPFLLKALTSPSP